MIWGKIWIMGYFNAYYDILVKYIYFLMPYNVPIVPLLSYKLPIHISLNPKNTQSHYLLQTIFPFL